MSSNRVEKEKRSPSCIHVFQPERVYSASIRKVASHFHWVYVDTPIIDLADELQRLPDLKGIGVVARNGKALGIVTRESMFSLLGKPFGRDILAKKLVEEILETVQVYQANANVFQVASDLDNFMQSMETRWYMLCDSNDNFGGLFTTQDLMRFLSRLTQEDIQLGARLQERLVPPQDHQEFGSWTFDSWSQPVRGVGGDFYCIRKVDDKHWFMALCDVSGKGVAASVISSLVWGMVQTFEFRHGLNQFLLHLNDALVRSFHLEKYLTGVFFIYNPEKRRLLVADMGHSHILLIRGKKAAPLRSPVKNFPLGIDQQVSPALYKLPLEEGDSIIAFTDGITEQEGGEASEEFGETRLLRALTSCKKQDERLGAVLPGKLNEWRGSRPQQDDMSYILLSVAGKSKEKQEIAAKD